MFHCENILEFLYIYFTYALWSTSIFTCIGTMISSFEIFFIIGIFFKKLFLCKCSRFLPFYVISAAPFLWIAFFFFVKKGSQNIFMQSFPLYMSILNFTQLDAHIIEIEYLREICSVTFVVGSFLRLFLHLFIF